jgi:hypothetical protein
VLAAQQQKEDELTKLQKGIFMFSLPYETWKDA